MKTSDWSGSLLLLNTIIIQHFKRLWYRFPQKYTNFGMWKTGSAKYFSQTLEKVPFRFRIYGKRKTENGKRKTENGKRKTEKNGFANTQLRQMAAYSVRGG